MMERKRQAERRKFHIIYRTTCSVNGKFYYGMHSTDNLNDGYIGSGTRLWHSIKKYGRDKFTMEILEFLPSREALKQRERELINEEVLKDPQCMNLMIGGEGGGEWKCNSNSEIQRAKGAKALMKMRQLRQTDPIWTAKTKANKSKAFLKLWASGQLKVSEKFRLSFLNKKHTEDTKRIIGEKNSIHQSGSSNSNYGLRWMSSLHGQLVHVDEAEAVKLESEGWQRGKSFKQSCLTQRELRVIELKQQIIDSEIDFTKAGWSRKLSDHLNLSSTYLKRFIRDNLPGVWKICYIAVEKRRTHLGHIAT